MTTTHDDRPHPVPHFAGLRWKENYFWLIMDAEAGVFGMSHLNNEPLFNRSRFSLNLSVRGKQYRYSNTVPFPTDYAYAPQLSDGRLTVRFVEPHERFSLDFAGDDFQAQILFEARRPTFDFEACKTGAPDLASFKEVMTLGLNLPYNHQQQSLTTTGTVTFRDGAKTETVKINGLGYRDHSWSMRTDNISRRHIWTGLNFPGRAFGIKVLETTVRPGLWAKEGYVSDLDGERVLRAIDATHHGSKDGWPAMTRIEVTDVFGKSFTIEADIAGRYADVPLHSEAPSAGTQSYEILETFCPLKLVESGEKGIGLVEIGRHPSVKDVYR